MSMLISVTQNALVVLQIFKIRDMKNLFLSAIFAILAFVCNAQIIKIVNVYEVATFNKDTLTENPFVVLRNPDFVGDTVEVSKRFIINFSDSTFIEYADGDIVSNGTIEISMELIGDGFCVILIDSDNHKRNLRSYLDMCIYLEQRNNITYVEYFEKFSIN